MTNHVGQQFGNYQLTRHLGTGGFGEVYLGTHVHLHREAAVKLLLKLDANEIEQFRKEAQIIADLIHPNVVTLFDYDVVDETPFIVMTYAAQGMLRDRYKRGTRAPLAEVVKYIAQAAEGLQFAHDHHIVHRDIKPENMLLGPNSDLLLSDFGIAVTWSSTRSIGTQNASGTLAYMAPEQIKGHPREASDQYSLAITAYEWLSGERPMAGCLGMIQSERSEIKAPSLWQVVPDLPSKVDAVLQRALASDWQARFPTIREFAQELAKAVYGVGQAPGIQPTTSTSPGNTSSGIPATIPAQPWRHQTRSITPPPPPETGARQMPAANYPFYAPSPPSSGVSYPLYAPPVSGGINNYTPANVLYSSPAQYALPATPGMGAIQGALAKKPKRPLALPLTRAMDARKSWLWTLGYTALLLLLSSLVIYFIITYYDISKAPTWANITDISLYFLLLIMSTTLCGALLGKWRGALTSLVVVGLFFLLLYLFEPLYFRSSTTVGFFLVYLMLPLTALVTGWIYERRSYASFGQSLLSMLTGNAFLIVTILIFDYALEPARSNSSFPSALTIILGGCLLIFAVSLLALVSTVLEVLAHKIVTSQQKTSAV
jgi:serine/threonine protein kinase